LGFVLQRRLALVVGSQCAALPALSFLPAGPGPVVVPELAERQALTVRLRDLLVDGPGECAPVLVDGQSEPGLLLNPTRARADAALIAALGQARAQQAVLLVHFVGHGTRFQDDPARPARHLLHVWDTVAQPTSSPTGDAWDPYATVAAMLPELVAGQGGEGMVGLVLLVDTCYASWAKQQVDGWGGVRAGLLSAWLGASGDQQAWDGCFTKTLVRVLESGLDAGEHPRRALLPELLAADVQPVLTQRCTSQSPRLGGYESHNTVLWIARNRPASELAAALGLDASVETVLLRLTGRYVSFAAGPVVDAVRAHRVATVVGGAGSGKSTLLAALRHPPADVEDLPLALVHALAFVSTDTALPDLARTLGRQLDRLPAFTSAAARFRRVNAGRWDTLDPWQQQITGPLTVYPDPVRLAVDGLDQLDGQPGYPAIRQALADLIADPALGRVRLLLTSRTALDLDGVEVSLSIPSLDPDTARRYLAAREVDPAVAAQLIELADGNWLVLELAADTYQTTGSAAGTLPALYTDLISRIRARHSSIDVLLALLAAAGTGPVLPLALLQEALSRLDRPSSRSELHRLLGHPELIRVIERTSPGQPSDRVGLFHQTLLTHLTTQAGPDAPAAREAHAALADAIDALAPASRHTPDGYRTDPLLTYGFDAGPRHRFAADRLDQLVTDIEARGHPHPAVNLARWTTWSAPLHDRLGRNHRAVLTTRANIAAWTGEAGDPDQALQLFTDLLPDLRRALGDDDRDTLTTRGNIAGWTGRTGHPDQALQLFTDLLPDLRRALGDDDRDTLATRGNIAGWTGQTGHPGQALRLFQGLLPDRQRVLGDDHPDTLTTRHNIARWTAETNHRDQALQLFQDLLPDRQRVLGDDHPDTLTTRHNIAAWTGRTGHPDQALQLFRDLLPDRQRVLGDDHPDTLATRDNIALWAGNPDTGVGDDDVREMHDRDPSSQ
jgi:hypothetical protein